MEYRQQWEHEKNNNKHNEMILGEIQKRIMKNFWGIILSGLLIIFGDLQ